MAGFPHHRYPTSPFHRFGERLRRLHVEHDRLALAGARQRVSSIDDQEVVAPDDIAGIVDDSNAVSIAVKGDPQVGAIFLDRCDQVLKVGWNRRIGMVVWKSSIALA